MMDGANGFIPYKIALVDIPGGISSCFRDLTTGDSDNTPIPDSASKGIVAVAGIWACQEQRIEAHPAFA
jgi:hypothetical protein